MASIEATMACITALLKRVMGFVMGITLNLMRYLKLSSLSMQGSFLFYQRAAEISRILQILLLLLFNFYFFSPNLPLIYTFLIHFSIEKGSS